MFRILPETIKNTENYERKVREIKRKQTTMDEDQKSAFNLAINGHILLITGQGGTGKSFLVKIVIKHLRTKVNKKPLEVAPYTTSVISTSINQNVEVSECFQG
jgi:Cdc6-like AAA superfamily ATPase